MKNMIDSKIVGDSVVSNSTIERTGREKIRVLICPSDQFG